MHTNANDAVDWTNLAITLQKRQRYEEALAAVEEALCVDPAYAEAMSVKAALLAKLKRNAEAILLFRAALALDPAMSTAWRTA